MAKILMEEVVLVGVIELLFEEQELRSRNVLKYVSHLARILRRLDLCFETDMTGVCETILPSLRCKYGDATG